MLIAFMEINKYSTGTCSSKRRSKELSCFFFVTFRGTEQSTSVFEIFKALKDSKYRDFEINI